MKTTSPVNGSACRIDPISGNGEATKEAEAQALTRKTKTHLVVVPLASIILSQRQIRRPITPESVCELQESIKQKGVIEPLVVRRVSSVLELVCGYRRFAAAKAAKLREVPVHIVDIDDKDILIYALHENIHRKDMSPIEEAEAYKAVLDEGRVKSQTELAKAVGVTQGRISQMLAILDLPEATRESFITTVMNDENSLTERHARVLRKIADPAKQEWLAKEAAEKGLTVRELEERAEEVESAAMGSPKKPVVRRMKWTRLDKSKYCRTRQGLKIEVRGKSWKDLFHHLEELIASIRKEEV